MHVTIIAPEASLYEGEADALVVPAYDGHVGILPNHAPFMTLLGRGILTLRLAGKAQTYAVDGGFLQVLDNTVRVVAENVEGESDAE